MFDNISYYTLLIIFIILMIIVLCIKSVFEYKKAKSRVMKENISRIASNKEFINSVIQYIRSSTNIRKTLADNYMPFDIFYDMCEDQLELKFKYDYENHIYKLPNSNTDNPVGFLNNFPYFPTLESSLKVFRETLDSIHIENELLRMYSVKFEEGIKEAEQIEKEAIAYHKSFGEEPSGDPKLHPKDNTDINEDDIITELSLEDLVKSGVAETLEEEEEYNNEDNNLNNF